MKHLKYFESVDNQSDIDLVKDITQSFLDDLDFETSLSITKLDKWHLHKFNEDDLKGMSEDRRKEVNSLLGYKLDIKFSGLNEKQLHKIGYDVFQTLIPRIKSQGLYSYLEISTEYHIVIMF